VLAAVAGAARWSALALAAGMLVATGVAGAAGWEWPPAGKPDRIEQDLTARNFYVVLDGSGSMNERACQGDGRKIEQAKAALEVFSRAVPRNVNLGRRDRARSTRHR
jgi:hypothetical protein